MKEEICKMKYVMYMHTGSGNHGCEAIIRTTANLLEGPKDVLLWSMGKEQDEEYGVSKLVEKIFVSEEINRYSLAYIKALFRRRIMKQKDANMSVFLKQLFKDNIAISVGGDNYCYPWSANLAVKINKEIRRYAKATILWGCSVDPEAIDQNVKEDLARYDLITARDPITYEVLKTINPYTVRTADSAFLLEKIDLDVPENFKKDNTVGINISPLIMEYGTIDKIILANYENLIQYILKETDMNICLIPHVEWEHNDDRKLCRLLFDKFFETGRVSMIPGGNCCELKGYIARCRFFVGARTHATIAAYSSFVPTLVVGYSVKSKGIARDLFGTEENYVMPVQQLDTEKVLVEKFKWLIKNEKKIHKILKEKMPSYIALAKKGQDSLKECIIRKG